MHAVPDAPVDAPADSSVAPAAPSPLIDRRSADVAIIGGGPAGSTAAALLKRKGWRVLLLEKDRHPRFHIGESLLPLNLPLFEQLGCAPAIKDVGLVKHAVQFHSMEHNASQIFAFADAWEGVPKHAYQVRRSEFDHALLNHARDCGAEIVEKCRAKSVHFESDRVVIEAQHEDGRAVEATARYLVDATGRDTFMASRLGIKRKNPKHTSAALYGHFRGAQRNAGAAEGDIEIYWFAHGWMWFIPLADGTTSVGRSMLAVLSEDTRHRFLDIFPAHVANLPAAVGTGKRCDADRACDCDRQLFIYVGSHGR